VVQKQLGTGGVSYQEQRMIGEFESAKRKGAGQRRTNQFGQREETVKKGKKCLSVKKP